MRVNLPMVTWGYSRLAESLLKRFKLVPRILLMRANLPMATWRYSTLHVVVLIHIKTTSYYKCFIMLLVFGQ